MTDKTSILLLGAGGHARACIDVIEQQGRHVIAGLIGLPDEVGSDVLGYPVLGGDSEIPALLARTPIALITIGQIKTPEPRIRLWQQLLANGKCPPAIISPYAYVSQHATVGEGSVVMHGAIVNAGARVGKNCILNSQSLIEHDTVVGDHCHVSTGARLNSGVQVGEGTFIGSGSSIRQGIHIGRYCVIGMGQTILKDCADGSQVPPRKVVSCAP